MKEVIVAVDFSECSINALEHALTIANLAKLDVMMVYVMKTDSIKDLITEPTQDIIAAVEKKFEEMIRKYKYKLRNSKIDFMIREKGKVCKEIVGVAKRRKVTMIVTGTHGTSGFEKFWAGSNANKMVSSSHCPIITIRGGVNLSKPLKKIVLSIDSSLETRQKVPFTAYLAKFFNSEIHVLGIYTTTIRAVRRKVDNYSDQVVKYLEENNIKNVLAKIEADNITTSTLDYCKKIEANLISIMTDQETTTANLWLGSYAQQMVNHSPVPVLTIHSKELIKSLSR